MRIEVKIENLRDFRGFNMVQLHRTGNFCQDFHLGFVIIEVKIENLWDFGY